MKIEEKWLTNMPKLAAVFKVGLVDEGYLLDKGIFRLDIQQMADIQKMVDFKHIFQQWNKGEEEQDLGYDTEFGIWIWPQLKKGQSQQVLFQYLGHEL